MRNNEIDNLGKGYNNFKVKLEIGSKLILYTDGLTEAVNPKIPLIEFGNSEMFQSIINYQKLSPKEFIYNLFIKLIEFRNSSEFDDDICIICLDIV